MEVVVTLTSIFCYLCVGFVIGFSKRSHTDVLAGRPIYSKNKLVLFLARKSSDIKGIDKLIYFFAMLLWLPLFFGSIATPIILSSKYAPDLMQFIFYGFIPVLLVGIFFGGRYWETMV